jgi:uncharacterized membrane protein
MLFAYRILPAVLTLMLARRSWALHFLIYIAPNRRLSGAVFSIKLIIPVTKHSVGHRGISSFVSFSRRRVGVLHIINRDRDSKQFLRLIKDILTHEDLLIY